MDLKLFILYEQVRLYNDCRIQGLVTACRRVSQVVPGYRNLRYR